MNLLKNLGFTQNFLEHNEVNDFKRMLKKLKDADKDVRNGRKRSFYLTTEYIKDEDLFDFLQLQNKFFYLKRDLEVQTSLNYLYDDAFAVDNGFYEESKLEALKSDLINEFGQKAGIKALKKLAPEQTPEQLKAWCDKAYPSITDDVWDLEFEKEVFYSQYLKVSDILFIDENQKEAFSSQVNSFLSKS